MILALLATEPSDSGTGCDSGTIPFSTNLVLTLTKPVVRSWSHQAAEDHDTGL